MFLKILIFIYLLIYNLQFLLKWHIFLTKVVIILLFLSFLEKIPQLTNLNYLIILLGLYSYILVFFWHVNLVVYVQYAFVYSYVCMLVHFLQTFFTYFITLRYTKNLYFYYLLLSFIIFYIIILVL